jgi:hypothetical protein
MTGYALRYRDPSAIWHAITDNVNSWLLLDWNSGLGVLPIEHASERTPYTDGEALVGEAWTGVRVMGVKIAMKDVSLAALTARWRTLARNLCAYKNKGTLGTLEVVTPDALTRYIPCWMVQCSDPAFDGPCYCEFALIFWAPSPWPYDPAQQEETFGLSNPAGATVPFVLDNATGLALAEDDVDDTFTANNGGDVESWPTIVVYGPGDNPSIENETTGKTLALTQTLDAGDTITIDMAAKTIQFYNSSVGLPTTSIMAAMSSTSEFWALRRGANVVHVTLANAGSGSLAFTWYDYFQTVL